MGSSKNTHVLLWSSAVLDILLGFQLGLLLGPLPGTLFASSSLLLHHTRERRPWSGQLVVLCSWRVRKSPIMIHSVVQAHSLVVLVLDRPCPRSPSPSAAVPASWPMPLPAVRVHVFVTSLPSSQVEPLAPPAVRCCYRQTSVEVLPVYGAHLYVHWKRKGVEKGRRRGGKASREEGRRRGRKAARREGTEEGAPRTLVTPNLSVVCNFGF